MQAPSRLTIPRRLDLGRPGARERIGALGLDFELVRSGHQPLSEAQISEFFNEDLSDAVAHLQRRVPEFDGMSRGRQHALIEMLMLSGPELFDAIVEEMARRGWSPASTVLPASEWFDRDQPSSASFDLPRDWMRLSAEARGPAYATQDRTLGTWAMAIAQARSIAQMRYESTSTGAFADLPPQLQSALTFAMRDHSACAERFWSAVADQRWNDALTELRGLTTELRDGPSSAEALLARAIEEGTLPATSGEVAGQPHHAAAHADTTAGTSQPGEVVDR